MKRIISTIFVVALLFIITACGGQQSNPKTQNTTQVVVPPPAPPQIEKINAGSMIKNESMEITINKVSLSYDVMPDKTDSFYTHYPADKGQVYIDVDVKVKNLQKKDMDCSTIMRIEADYNNGYKYSSMPVVKDNRSGFTYANISAIKPLDTKGMKYLIKCPEEVEKTKNPLFLILSIDGKKYQYTIR